MKKIGSFSCLLLLAGVSFSQPANNEFELSENGLIYSNKAISQLRHVVDSLSLKFKTCDLSRVFLSVPQAKAHYIELNDERVLEARKDIENNISFEDFVAKYPFSIGQKDMLVVYDKDETYYHDPYITFFSLGTDETGSHEVRVDTAYSILNAVKGKWWYDYEEKTSYSRESIKAFYFTSEFIRIPLPEKHARLVQYSDCLVDTTAEIFLPGAISLDRAYDVDHPYEENIFLAWLRYQGEPVPPYREKDFDAWYKEYGQWRTRKDSFVTHVLSKTPDFKKKLVEAIECVRETRIYDAEFEDYVQMYYSPKVALAMKRSRIVVGRCSRDEGPRLHALDIARLSAETTNWETFLRAHLDIMNDRFERTFNSSYAQRERKTYIKELEVLDINVPDLLLGIGLRIDNPAQRHYFGSIGRIGRALAETAQPDAVEERILTMIADSTLDAYNRLQFYYLFNHYNYNIEDKKRRQVNEGRLDAAVKTLPANLVMQPINELRNHELIYSSRAINKLKQIVDSLHLQFNASGRKVYTSRPQARAHYVSLSKGDVEKARKDMDNNISFDAFLARYPACTVEKDLLVLTDAYKSYGGTGHAKFYSTTMRDTGGVYTLWQEVRTEQYKLPGTGKWLYTFEPKGLYAKASLKAFYLCENLRQTPLPQPYSRMVQYVDSLVNESAWQVDTNEDAHSRQYAMNAARLAAETANWKSFLSTHLNIIYALSLRNVDSSYGLKRRKTYVKELEAINIHVYDLLLGISLRIDSAAQHHYFGQAGVLGSALAESEHTEAMEDDLLSMIANSRLDTYNRLQMYELFRSYNESLEDETRKRQNEVRLEEAKKTLPAYLFKKVSP